MPPAIQILSSSTVHAIISPGGLRVRQRPPLRRRLQFARRQLQGLRRRRSPRCRRHRSPRRSRTPTCPPPPTAMPCRAVLMSGRPAHVFGRKIQHRHALEHLARGLPADRHQTAVGESPRRGRCAAAEGRATSSRSPRPGRSPRPSAGQRSRRRRPRHTPPCHRRPRQHQPRSRHFGAERPRIAVEDLGCGQQLAVGAHTAGDDDAVPDHRGRRRPPAAATAVAARPSDC